MEACVSQQQSCWKWLIQQVIPERKWGSKSKKGRKPIKKITRLLPWVPGVHSLWKTLGEKCRVWWSYANPPSQWLKCAPEDINSSVLVTCRVLLLCLSGLLRPDHPSGSELKMLVVGMHLACKGMVSAKRCEQVTDSFCYRHLNIKIFLYSSTYLMNTSN